MSRHRDDTGRGSVAIDTNQGPEYPRELGSTVSKFRAKARHGLKDLTRDQRRAYGDAVDKAIRAKQKSEAHAGLSPARTKCHCASGTAHNTGEAIDRAIREQQRAALLAAPAQERRARPDHVWRDMYAKAMQAKQEKTNGPASVSKRINPRRVSRRRV